MASYRFSTAGDDYDDSDDDGFVLNSDDYGGEEDYDYQPRVVPKQTPEAKVVPQNGSNVSSKSRGGFGSRVKPAKPIAPKTNGNVVPVDDFKTAVMKGNVDVVERHLLAGVQVDTILKTGWTPLMYAASCSNLPMVRVLLQKGANVNFNKDMFTVLMAACGSNRVDEAQALECVEMLMNSGANINTHDRYHMSPLIYAAREGRSTVVRKLLDGKAAINKQDNRGWTALVWAASKNHLKTVQVLVDAGADVNILCTDGQKAGDFAPENSKVASILMSGGKPSRSSMIQADDIDRLAQGDAEEDIAVKNTQFYIKYGDLELLLCGLQLGKLIPLFQEQKVAFTDLLKMTDHDLQQLGVSQIGYRKKILDGIHQVHKKDWEPTSLTSVQYNKQLSCPEAIAIISNITKHTSYIGCSIAYVKGQLTRDPKILQKENDGSVVELLSNQNAKALENVIKVYQELEHLQEQLSKLEGIKEYSPPDLIQTKYDTSRRRFGLVTVCGLLFLTYWHKDRLTNAATELSNFFSSS